MTIDHISVCRADLTRLRSRPKGQSVRSWRYDRLVDRDGKRCRTPGCDHKWLTIDHI